MAQLLDNMMTTAELAKELKRSPETLIRWRRCRSFGPPWLTIAGRVLYSRTEVESWLKAQSVKAGTA